MDKWKIDTTKYFDASPSHHHRSRVLCLLNYYICRYNKACAVCAPFHDFSLNLYIYDDAIVKLAERVSLFIKS